jgi:hypothetical protein
MHICTFMYFFQKTCKVTPDQSKLGILQKEPKWIGFIFSKKNYLKSNYNHSNVPATFF